uniref:Uncharacterized protein n=1 Tax=Steinernema glaseri TaxID=37863 RepID=A0A1I8ARL3_9BILA
MSSTPPSGQKCCEEVGLALNGMYFKYQAYRLPPLSTTAKSGAENIESWAAGAHFPRPTSLTLGQVLASTEAGARSMTSAPTYIVLFLIPVTAENIIKLNYATEQH